MQKIVPANDFGLRVGKKSEGETQPLPVTATNVRRVNTDRDYANSACFELRDSMLKTPQLGVA